MEGIFDDISRIIPAPEPIQRQTPEYTQEPTVAGVELNNYTKRVPNDEGTYVFVTVHEERIELIRQPPTPEELEAKRKLERTALRTLGVVGVVFIGFLGWAVRQDAKRDRGAEIISAE